MQKLIEKSVAVFLFFLLTAIVIGTSFFCHTTIDADKYHLPLPSYAYYIGAIALLTVLIHKHTSITPLIHRYKRVIRISSMVLILATGALLTKLILTDFNEDYIQLHNFVVDFPNVCSKQDAIDYFSHYPYQLNVATIMAMIYKVISSWRLIIFIGFLSSVATCVMATLTIRNLTHSKTATTMTLLLSLTLIALQWKSFYPYTDNFAMFFPVAALFVTTLRMKRIYKACLFVLLAYIGYFVKITTLIPIIAITISYAPKYFNKDENPKKWLKVLPAALLTLCLAIGMTSILHSTYQFTPDKEKACGVTHFLNMGQNNTSYGVYNDDDFKFSTSFSTLKERNKACLESAVSRIKNRGLWENCLFYEKKLIIMSYNGLFIPLHQQIAAYERIKDFSPESSRDADLVAILMLPYSGIFDFYSSIEQILWCMVLLLTLISVFTKKDRYITALQLTFIGNATYLLLFENGAYYIYMLLPFYVILSIITLKELVAVHKTSMWKPKR